MFVCGPAPVLETISDSDIPVRLFDQVRAVGGLSAGAAVKTDVRRRKLAVPQLAWEFVSIALSVMVADGAVRRDRSPDGWTRELSLEIAVTDPGVWNTQVAELEQALGFLTTDLWYFSFIAGGETAQMPTKVIRPEVDAVGLLSGGLDSLIGAIDLTARGVRLLPVSKTVRGDADKQVAFAKQVIRTDDLLQLNDNANTRRAEKETSQRARSLIFIAFAVLAASATARYAAGERTPIYLCENGFIAINPPLTESRLGSLSTRTAHPEFLARVQRILDALSINVEIRNPYALKTKGEMMIECRDQDLLERHAAFSTSCGRFQRYNYVHCGRCVPCQIRRASFLAWGTNDTTDYVFDDLSRRDADHAQFDDVMSVAMALAAEPTLGLDRWIGTSLSSPFVSSKNELRAMVGRGLGELRALHQSLGVW